MTNRFKCPVFIVVGIAVLGVSSALGAGVLGISLDPGDCSFFGVDTLTAHVTVDSAVVDLRGFELRFLYDPLLLEVVSVELGALVTGGPCSFFPALLSANAGVIEADAAGLGCSVSGSGEILRVRFVGVNPGVSLLRCQSSDLRDSTNQPILHGCPDAEIGFEVPHVGLLPSLSVIDLGEIVDLELTVPAACDSFNAYETTIEYEPSHLTFIEGTQAEQEGELMTAACTLRFHQFQESQGIINLTHGLLCAGQRVAGHGVLYRLRFQVGAFPAITTVRIRHFRFADAGKPLSSPLTGDATLYIGDTAGLPPGDDGGAPGSLFQSPHPNPFQTSIHLPFTSARDGRVCVAVYTVSGRLVCRLFDDAVAAGASRTVTWDGRDRMGRRVPSGIYLGRLDAPDGVQARRFLKMR